MKIFNTLSRKVEKFEPINPPSVGIYTCGPTVYSRAHIGNLRTFVSTDILKRILNFLGYKVSHVMNITDVDDKIIKESKGEKNKQKEITQKYEKLFFDDLKELNIEMPEKTPRATENIQKMVDMIKNMVQKGYAYKTEDGIYFSIQKSKNYGELAGLKNVSGTKIRIKNDKYEKDNPQDFALWKFYDKEDGQIYWDTEIGKGRPGWHIECSAMSTKCLGESFDIHTGGTDLIFPHHTNEIAQSEAVSGERFVKYWVHGGFLNIKENPSAEAEKMSKSIGNVITLDSLKEKNINPLAYRYLTLTSHYRSEMNFSWEALIGAQSALEKLFDFYNEFGKNIGKADKKYVSEFKKLLEDDLAMPEAVALVWKLVKDDSVENEDKKATLLEFDKIFAFGLDKLKKEEIPQEIRKLASERELARKNKEWEKADQIRKKIEILGYELKDTKNGFELKSVK
ncbi:cysteine--tRNA ligase [Patescibacteria group bacterium]|nr:cysteine--tRNA ligase [Patescibacteria group bacterium]MBU4057377.1 cysteine--tRNA ligase [Patescibacteria group bacterium]MBU4115991.1 cysteine--tRNA ligase [Patescibacteria group bacterium]